MQHDGDEDLAERCAAELEFVAAAYDSKEAWCSRGDDGVCSVYRRLVLPLNDDDDDGANETTIVLMLKMPRGYPSYESLDISAAVDGSCNVKSVWDVLPSLLEACRDEAANALGEEAVLTVLSRADEWIQEEWYQLCAQEETLNVTEPNNDNVISSTAQILGRRLIYSHHLISKIKRADIKDLASHYELTGYMKIGWPGIILIEGLEENCISFYDDIRGWSWKYLVVRGEQQDVDGVASLKFSSFIETEDMSVVAEHCRQVGLEALFKTSMKVYSTQDEDDQEEEELLGTLVVVDHMNDGKQYRKWLRTTARQLDCLLFIQQCYLDYAKKPLIIVGVVGTNVSEFMKRWRTSRVDVDSKGRPCLERQMTVIIDGLVDCSRVDKMDWDKIQSEANLNASLEQVQDLIKSVGGIEWSNAFQECVHVEGRA